MERMPDFLTGNLLWWFTLAIIVPCGIALFCSLALHWAGKRSPLWNIGFAVGVVLTVTVLLLVAVIAVLRRLSL
jgi:hypothetical protein